MAEFEELRLTVNLVDNASAGLQRLRTEVTNLTQSASSMTTGFGTAVTAVNNLGAAVQKATPALRSAQQEMRALGRAGSDMGVGMSRMLMSVRGGVGALPQFTQGLQQAVGGMSTANTAMVALGVSSRVAILGIAGVTLGLVAVGAAVALYGYSVFKFAREMEGLSKSARMLGVSFAALKNAQDQAKALGYSAESIIRAYQGIQDAQFDLYKNNSQLRQKLIGQGVDAGWVNQLATMEPTKARNAIVAYGNALMKEAQGKGWSENASRALAQQFIAEFGLGKEQLDIPIIKEPDEKTKRELAEIEKLSKEVAVIWGEIGQKWDKLSLEVLSAGLPLLKSTLEWVSKKLDQLKEFIDWFNKHGLSRYFPKRIPIPALPIPIPGLGAPNPFRLFNRTSLSGDNDNNPLFQRISYSTDELTDQTGENTSELEKVTWQLERLNAYYDRLEGKANDGRSRGGIMNAALTTGGGGTDAGGGGGKDSSGFGSPDYPAQPSTTPPDAGAQPAAPPAAAPPSTTPSTAGAQPAAPPAVGDDAAPPTTPPTAGAQPASGPSSVPGAAAPSIPAAAGPSIPAAAAPAPATASDPIAGVLGKLPEGARAQAKGFLDKLSPSEKADVLSGKTSINSLIDQKAPFGMGGIAKGYIGSNYPGGMKGLQKDITTPSAPSEGAAKPQGFGGEGLYDGMTGEWIPGTGKGFGVDSSRSSWDKFRRSQNIEDRRDEKFTAMGGHRQLLARKLGMDYSKLRPGNDGRTWTPPHTPITGLAIDAGILNLDPKAVFEGAYPKTAPVADLPDDTSKPNWLRSGAGWVAGKVRGWRGQDTNVTTPSTGGVRGFYDSGMMDRGALDRGALNDDTMVRADGNVRVSVGISGGAGSGSSRAGELFERPAMQGQQAFQETVTGPNVADTANDYMTTRKVSQKSR